MPSSNVASTIPCFTTAAAALLPYLAAAQAPPTWTPAPPANITIPIIAKGKDGDETSFPVIPVVGIFVVLILIVAIARIIDNIRKVNATKIAGNTAVAHEETLLSVVTGDDGSGLSPKASFGYNASENGSFGRSSVL